MNKYLTKSSPHYQFHFLPSTLAEKEIDKIIRSQEAEYDKILQFLGVTNDRIINYYLYPSRDVKGEMTGDDGNGHADRQTFSVYAVYNDETKCIGAHEDTHLLANSLGLPPQLFREGLAEYMSGKWHGKNHDDWTREFINNKTILSLDKIIDDEEWYEVDDMISYPMAGSFVKYLLDTLGKEKFFELYKELNRDLGPSANKSQFEKITGKSVFLAQREWTASLIK